MFGLTGVLIALIVLTIMLAGVFLLRPSITAGATGKILAFIGLCVLPGLCIGTGMSFHMQRSEQTAYCISCHSMETHGQSLYVLNTSYIPAQHFQNHLVPSDKACYTCHTDYTMYGPLKDKLKGLKYVYMEYVSTPPKTIHLEGTYSNLQCLQCHAGTRDFEANLNRMPPMASLVSNQISCISNGCHDTIHNASEVAHLKMWVEGTPPPPLASASASPAPANAQPSAAAGSPKAPAASSSASAAGKGIFDSQGCAGCHGAAGAGGSGPALTHVSSQYPPAKLTAVLKAPTAGMKAAGMVPLTVNAADMKSLVSYVSSLGGTSAAAAGKSTSHPSAKAEPVKTAAPSNAASATAPPAPGAAPPAAANAQPPAAAGSPKAPAASDATAAAGKGIFDSQGCAGCHGAAGAGGTGPALTHVSSQYPPAQLTAVLKTPTAGMKAAGMVPLTVNAADMASLVSYVSSLGGAAATLAAAPVAAGSAPPAAANAQPPAAAGSPKTPAASSASDATAAAGKSIFDSQGCAGCHGAAGAGGTGPALTHVSSQYPPAQLTAVLKTPTAGMKTAGMVPLTVNAADMKALVAYVSSLGGASAASATAAPAAAGAVATAAVAKPKSKAKSAFGYLFSP